jgi:uncharacterized protein (DUF2252 family)
MAAKKKVRVMSERLDLGRQMRQSVPRAAHAEWESGPDRSDTIATLEASNVGRLPELVPIRFGRMLINPFAYLRGSAPVMTRDLATLPSTGTRVQLCGDCHLMNFGIFATPERNLAFGLNDFDETLPGPWEFDVKRLAASFAVAAQDVEMSDDLARAAAERVVRSYREHLWGHVDQSPLEIWYDRITTSDALDEAPNKARRERRQKLIDKAESRVGDQLVAKLLEESGQKMQIVDQPPLIFHPSDIDILGVGREFLATYRDSLPADRRLLIDRYELKDVAYKVVGVGSVGTRCFVALLASSAGFPLFLQVKEANDSVLAPVTGAGPIAHNGERVVVGQRLMQATSDIFLGWGTGPEGRQFYVRQLRDMKLSIEVRNDPEGLNQYAEFCGRALARAHANSGDGPVIAGYLGKSDAFDKALGSFALKYAAQTVTDHRALEEARKDGRIDVIDELA